MHTRSPANASKQTFAGNTCPLCRFSPGVPAEPPASLVHTGNQPGLLEVVGRGEPRQPSADNRDPGLHTTVRRRLSRDRAPLADSGVRVSKPGYN